MRKTAYLNPQLTVYRLKISEEIPLKTIEFHESDGMPVGFYHDLNKSKETVS